MFTQTGSPPTQHFKGLEHVVGPAGACNAGRDDRACQEIAITKVKEHLHRAADPMVDPHAGVQNVDAPEVLANRRLPQQRSRTRDLDQTPRRIKHDDLEEQAVCLDDDACALFLLCQVDPRLGFQGRQGFFGRW